MFKLISIILIPLIVTGCVTHEQNVDLAFAEELGEIIIQNLPNINDLEVSDLLRSIEKEANEDFSEERSIEIYFEGARVEEGFKPVVGVPAIGGNLVNVTLLDSIKFITEFLDLKYELDGKKRRIQIESK